MHNRRVNFISRFIGVKDIFAFSDVHGIFLHDRSAKRDASELHRRSRNTTCNVILSTEANEAPIANNLEMRAE